MRFLALAVLALLVGCGPSIREMGTLETATGKLTLKSQPFGDVAITVQPLADGYPKTIQVAADGTFKTDLVPGKYVFSIGQSSSKSSEQALKKVDPKYYDTSMDRTFVVAAGQEVVIALD